MSYLKFSCDINIKENVLDLELDNFLEIAVRNNSKRRFLFVSKLLGKHLPCKPEDMDNLGKLIVEAYNRKRNSSSGVVISFAETGTAIGHSVFDYIEGDYEFIHTTREKIDNLSTLDFLEEHSHATNHNIYIDNLHNLKYGEEIILVDDEITTAKTCINLIRKIHSLYPKNKYTICSILNWVEGENINRIKTLEKELNCTIEFVYLFKGDFDFILEGMELSQDKKISHNINKDLKVDYINLDMKDYLGDKRYLKYTGRFGINKEDQNRLKEIVKEECKKINIENTNSKILFLGTEEFMYIPMLFAKYSEGDIYYHSITRSPIINMDKENYSIKSKFELKSFYNKEVQNYIYNIDKHDYSECFLFIELHKDKNDNEEIINIFKQTSIKKLNIVYC